MFEVLQNLEKSSLLLIDVMRNRVALEFVARDAAPETGQKLLREAFDKGRLVKVSKRMPSAKEVREVCKLVYDWSVDGPIMSAYFMMTAAVNAIRNHSYFVSGYLMTLILYTSVHDRAEMTFGIR